MNNFTNAPYVSMNSRETWQREDTVLKALKLVSRLENQILMLILVTLSPMLKDLITLYISTNYEYILN